MEEYIGKICPFCKTEIKEGDAVQVCPACGIPHHAECWEENKGCTTFGCSEQHYEEQHTNPTDVCGLCGTPLGDGQMFCPNCGTAKSTAKGEETAPKANVCAKCGAELREGQAFCPQCGQKVGLAVDSSVNSAIHQFNAGVQKQSKKKKRLPIILIILLAIAAVAGGIVYSSIQKKNAEEAIAEYMRNAKSFYTKVLSSGSTLEDIGNEIQKSWRAYVKSERYNGRYYYSVDDAISAALSNSSYDVSSVKNADSSIESLYKKLLTVPDTSNQELLEIKDAVKDAYKAYQNMYDCIISPSGNYNTWTSDFGDVDSDLADTIRDLGNLVN